MPLLLDQLPDDIETLKRWVIEQQARSAALDVEVAQWRAQVEAKQAEVIAARLMIEKLKLQIAPLRRIQFGRKSTRQALRSNTMPIVMSA